jgi:D-sedoheptulose 7-phosphate isomerase
MVVRFADAWSMKDHLALLTSTLNRIEVENHGFEAAVMAAKGVRKRYGRVFFIGNGGSAAIASHMAIDFLNKAKVAAMAFNDAASLTCLANDHGYEQVFERPLVQHSQRGDLLFAISSSGKSKNILRPAMAFLSVGTVITLSGFAHDNPLRGVGNVNFYVPSDNYGIVETAHLAILHALLDRVAA